jgi:hypothetical protein
MSSGLIYISHIKGPLSLPFTTSINQLFRHIKLLQYFHYSQDSVSLHQSFLPQFQTSRQHAFQHPGDRCCVLRSPCGHSLPRRRHSSRSYHKPPYRDEQVTGTPGSCSVHQYRQWAAYHHWSWSISGECQQPAILPCSEYMSLIMMCSKLSQASQTLSSQLHRRLVPCKALPR